MGRLLVYSWLPPSTHTHRPLPWQCNSRGWLPQVEWQLSSLFEMSAGKRAQPLVEAGAVVMALLLVVAGTMQVQPPAILGLLSPTLLAAVLRHSLLLANGSLGP